MIRLQHWVAAGRQPMGGVEAESRMMFEDDSLWMILHCLHVFFSICFLLTTHGNWALMTDGSGLMIIITSDHLI